MKLVIGFAILACVQVGYAAFLVWRKKRIVSNPHLRAVVSRILN